MSIYSVDKLMSQARKIAADYRRATGKSLGIGNEIAKNDACNYLNLQPINDNASSFDAVGKGQREGLKILIKGRAIFDKKKSGTRIGQLKVDQEWDLLVLVLMNEDFDAYEIYEISRVQVIAEIDSAAQSNRSKRGAMSISRFKRISQLVWSKNQGYIDTGVWDNQAGS
ncbi:hypothetical protein MNBD_GAMMA22-686 [hydrothermal vent metagenome]|uniref:Uncharacterized protein n=1 Tax=hydrothermal vent metagenome TaxID=652676 RepID=A0A3B0ZVF5_9ZZZZ